MTARPTHRLRPFALVIATILLAGCGPARLETGYVPRPLGSTEDQRKGYYAGPFSPEARAAQAESGPREAPAGPAVNPRTGGR